MLHHYLLKARLQKEGEHSRCAGNLTKTGVAKAHT